MFQLKKSQCWKSVTVSRNVTSEASTVNGCFSCTFSLLFAHMEVGLQLSGLVSVLAWSRSRRLPMMLAGLQSSLRAPEGEYHWMVWESFSMNQLFQIKWYAQHSRLSVGFLQGVMTGFCSGCLSYPEVPRVCSVWTRWSLLMLTFWTARLVSRGQHCSSTTSDSAGCRQHGQNSPCQVLWQCYPLFLYSQKGCSLKSTEGTVST